MPPGAAGAFRGYAAELARAEAAPQTVSPSTPPVLPRAVARSTPGPKEPGELRNDSQMLFTQPVDIAPKDRAAVERCAELAVELQERSEQVLQLQAMVDQQAAQMRELEDRVVKTERDVSHYRNAAVREKKLRATAESRQRDLLRQLQEQESELARQSRRDEGQISRLEAKVLDLKERSVTSSVKDGQSDASSRRGRDDSRSHTSSLYSVTGRSRGTGAPRSTASASSKSLTRMPPRRSGLTRTMRAKRVDFRDLCEIKALSNPPEPVKLVMEIFCVLFDVPPAKLRDSRNRSYVDYWMPAKKTLLADPYFVTKLQHFDRPLKPAQLEKIQPYLDHPDFSDERLRRSNVATANLACWLRELVNEK